MKTTISFLTQEETKRLFAAIPTKRDHALFSSPPTATACGSSRKISYAIPAAAVPVSVEGKPH